MKIRILGCSGGIGGRHLRTTSLLVDNDILIDAGTGVGDLAIAELAVVFYGTNDLEYLWFRGSVDCDDFHEEDVLFWL